MTLKEKVRETNLYNVDDCYHGGVFACPADYSYLNDETDININCYSDGIINDSVCRQCWNREYKECTNE